MRQAGVLAAAGIIALETMVDRLTEDHIRADNLARGLSEIPGFILDPGTPNTNMVFLSLAEEYTSLTSGEVAQRLEERGVKVSALGKRRFRLVTHYWIDDAAVEDALQAFADVL
jgi:threonine aldolase